MDQKNSQEAVQRRARSEAVLRADGVPINQYLPVIETEDETKRRSKAEISQRALCVLLAAVKGEGLEQPVVERIPVCDSCNNPMSFVAQLEQGPDWTTAMNFGGGGCAYVYRCTCRTHQAKMLWQC
ncbi:DUF4272 domain-containing protein [Collimonas sp. H4R21]|uniref:DUF4272 domain-containing protein n=1 Tax=Collimonas rhizosphaerae TaxID=3126357 RepID=A0ABU9PTM1_9BURK